VEALILSTRMKEMMSWSIAVRQSRPILFWPLRTRKLPLIPIHEIIDTKWKEEGKHINYLISLEYKEKIVCALPSKNSAMISSGLGNEEGTDQACSF
jgi:DNA gyrase/topoisomerase IV subunit A